jgi:tetratricopeptide (TPR) repeat protein
MLRDRSGERSRGSVSIYLESPGWRWAFALFVFLIGTSLFWQATQAWIAAEYAASAKPELWRSAAQWEPDNAAYWAQLGSMETWDLERGDLDQAAADYERAVQVNPHSDRDWLALAGIYERRGQISQAQAAFEKAQHNHPISPAVAWAYGNFVLRQGNASEACSEFRKALQTDPELTEDAMEVWWKSGLYTSQPISELLPSENRYYFKALDYFGRQNKIDAGLRVWDELLMLGQHFQLPQVLPFIDEMIFADRVRDAQRVWRQALDFSRWPRDAQEESSLIFNGGFEHGFANGGFDWREQESADISFAFDMEIAHTGASSVRVTFNGKSNIDFHNVFQYVPVEEGRRYRFEAYLKSFALSTDSGIRFLISDPLHPALPLILTEGITGTQAWTRIETEIVTGPATRLVSIVLRRTPSLKFDNKLGGTVWVDDVSLVALAGDDINKSRQR